MPVLEIDYNKVYNDSIEIIIEHLKRGNLALADYWLAYAKRYKIEMERQYAAKSIMVKSDNTPDDFPVHGAFMAEYSLRGDQV